MSKDKPISRKHARKNQNQTLRRSLRLRNMHQLGQHDPVSLCFHDSCLRMSDVQLLQGREWLNDQILSFYYEYLSNVKYRNSAVYFIAPEVTQCMKYMNRSELEVIFNRYNAADKSLIFFVLNDNKTAEAGGTHWSLLVLYRPKKTFFHADSSGKTNASVSIQFSLKVTDALGVQHAKYCALPCLQQTNGYDCGIHVICMTDHIADYVTRCGKVEGLPLLRIDTVASKRAQLLNLVRSLGGHTNY